MVRYVCAWGLPLEGQWEQRGDGGWRSHALSGKGDGKSRAHNGNGKAVPTMGMGTGEALPTTGMGSKWDEGTLGRPFRKQLLVKFIVGWGAFTVGLPAHSLSRPIQNEISSHKLVFICDCAGTPTQQKQQQLFYILSFDEFDSNTMYLSLLCILQHCDTSTGNRNAIYPIIMQTVNRASNKCWV